MREKRNQYGMPVMVTDWNAVAGWVGAFLACSAFWAFVIHFGWRR